MSVTLNDDALLLEEAVAVGYGVQRKSDVTGAVARVESATLNSRPVNNAFEALQGKVAGVDITSNERPGNLGSIRIRCLPLPAPGRTVIITNSSAETRILTG